MRSVDRDGDDLFALCYPALDDFRREGVRSSALSHGVCPDRDGAEDADESGPKSCLDSFFFALSSGAMLRATAPLWALAVAVREVEGRIPRVRFQVESSGKRSLRGQSEWEETYTRRRWASSLVRS